MVAPDISLGGVGVYIFFAISGYLNAHSLLKRESVANFLLARALRIYPAVIAMTLVTVVMCAFMTSVPLGDYFSSAETREFLVRNSLMLYRVLAQSLPGVFDGSHVPRTVNASLWTIPYEIVCYVFLGVGAAFFRYSNNVPRIFLLVFAGIAIFCQPWISANPNQMYRFIAPLAVGPFVQFGTIFFLGATAAAIERASGRRAALLFLVIFAALLFLSQQVMMGCLSAGIAAVIAIGSLRAPWWLSPRWDISFGVYLYAFPMQQIAASMTNDFWSALAIACPATLLAAVLSCLLVERPALKLKDRIYKRRPGFRLAAEA